MMTISSSGAEKTLPEGTSVRACLEALNAFPEGTLAALKGGVVAELDEPVSGNCSLLPLTLAAGSTSAPSVSSCCWP